MTHSRTRRSTATYGIVLGLAAVGYTLTGRAIIAVNGRDSAVARAAGRDWKGRGSILLYFAPSRWPSSVSGSRSMLASWYSGSCPT